MENVEDLQTICAMLTGNISRMMITHNMEELIGMYSFAIQRLNTIYQRRCETLLDELVKNIVGGSDNE